MKKSIMFLFVASVFSASYAEKEDITTTTTITTDSASEYYYENYNNDTIYMDPDSSITLNLGSATEPMPGLTLVNGDDNLASLTAIGAQNQIPTVNFYGYTIVDDVRLERIYSFNVKSDATLKVNGSINSVFNQYERSNKITFDAGSKTTVEGKLRCVHCKW